MSYTRSTTIDSSPTGDTVKQAVLDLDTDLTAAFVALNEFIQKSLGTTKGDLIVYTASGVPTRLAVSATDGLALVSDSTQATGLGWAVPGVGVLETQVFS